MRAAIAVGLGKRDDGSWDYDAAQAAAEKLLRHKDVVGHLSFLAKKFQPKNLALDYDKFSSLLSEMALVTFDDFFVYDAKLKDYVLKPFHMLTKAELMCLEDVDEYHVLVEQTQTAGARSMKRIRIKLVDRTKLLDMFAKINGFYDPEARGRSSQEELATKLRAAAALLERSETQ
jgi:hypothetical protein